MSFLRISKAKPKEFRFFLVHICKTQEAPQINNNNNSQTRVHFKKIKKAKRKGKEKKVHFKKEFKGGFVLFLFLKLFFFFETYFFLQPSSFCS